MACRKLFYKTNFRKSYIEIGIIIFSPDLNIGMTLGNFSKFGKTPAEKIGLLGMLVE